jgi:hypothetical protein
LDFAFFGDNPDLSRSSASNNWRLSSPDSKSSLPLPASDSVVFPTCSNAFLLAARFATFKTCHRIEVAQRIEVARDALKDIPISEVLRESVSIALDRLVATLA